MKELPVIYIGVVTMTVRLGTMPLRLIKQSWQRNFPAPVSTRSEMKRGPKPKTGRDRKILEYAQKGLTFGAIAKIFHICPCRVVQIVGKARATPSCPHYWFIERPSGQTSQGTCRRVGAVKTFSNSITMERKGLYPHAK